MYNMGSVRVKYEECSCIIWGVFVYNMGSVRV